MSIPVQVGQKAPAFALYDTTKKKVSLEDLQGKNVLLLFFPLAFTSVCTAELCAVRDDITRYQQAEAEILGVSVDSLYALGKFREEQGLNFPLLSDFNKTTSRAYGAIYDHFGYDMEGVSKRAAFLIDKEGIIRYAEVLENAGMQPDFEAIQAMLENMN